MPATFARRAAASLLAVPSLLAQTQFMPSQERSGTSFLPAGVGGVAGMAIFDADGDGDRDVVAAGDQVHRLYLREQNGWTTVNLALLGGGRQPRPADIDGDGDLDLLFAPRDGTSPTSLGMLRNDGAGVLASVPLPIPLPGALVQGAVIGDVDGDGDGDLVLGVVPGTVPLQSIQLFRNLGGMTLQFEPAAMPAGGIPYGCHPELADVDGDGDLDVVANSLGSGAVLLRNNGLGIFTDDRASLPASRIGHVFTATGDLDGDGSTDAALVWWNGDVDVLWGGAGALAFQSGIAPGSKSRRIVPGDVDADGDLDLLSFRADGCDLLRNLGARQFALERVHDSPVTLTGDAVGDLDGDGRADVLVATASQPQVRVFFATPVGFVGDAAADRGFRQIAMPLQLRQPAIAGDVDGDGRQDVLMPSTIGLVVQHGLGAGRYRGVLLPAPAASIGATEHPHLADLDRDGDPDLLLGSTGPLRAFRNDGTGAFAAWFQLPGSTTAGDALQIDDVDADGDADLVRIGPGGPELHRNRGAGTFDPPVLLAPAPGDRRCLLLADVDGDGDRDLVTDIVAAPQHLLLRNDGSGNFAADPALQAVLGTQPAAVAGGDADGDGDVDLVVLDTAGQALRLLRNDGTGRFAEAVGAMPAVTPASPSGNALLFEDFDGDGDRDVFALIGTGGLGRQLLVNDGTGTFLNLTISRWSVPVIATGTPVAAVATDFDGDGDLDIAMGSSAVADQTLAWNHTRELLSRELPQLGGSVVLDAFSGPGYGATGLMLVLASLDQRGTPLRVPGIEGSLDLDSTVLATLNVALTSSVGISRTILPVPAQAQFVGTRLFFQALSVPATGVAGFTRTTAETIVP